MSSKQLTKRYRRPGKRYPEQSTRQALCGQRRAQGGPGLAQTTRGTWVAREQASA